MRSQACELCAKRKIKCDREEPCLNCKRKHLGCVYPDDHSNERIKQLEALVRRLGGDPEHLDHAIETPSQAKTLQPHEDGARMNSGGHGSDSVIVQEQNESLYLETPIWRAMNGKYFGPVSSFKSKEVPAELVATTEGSHMFQSMFVQQETSFHEKHPSPQSAAFLWSKFFQRVHPMLKVFFEWEVAEIRTNCIEGTALSNQQYAFAFALYLLTVQSFPEGDCSMLGRSKAELLAEYQYLCEQALVASKFLTTYDILTLRTLVIYLFSLLSQMKVNGLCDAMGLVLRKAERIGLHRDGSLLKLSPFETERRRRIWWAIQGLDLASNVTTGATSMSLMADWDTQLPLNIEDGDISPQMQEMPKQRSGLTSMSHCLVGYWVIQQQRTFRGPDGQRLGVSWSVNTSLSIDVRRSLIDRLENGLNERYLRFCDPIKALDMTMLITSRAWITFLRRATLLPGRAFKDARDFTKEDQRALLASSIQMLEYHLAICTRQDLEPFRWYSRTFFPWTAFVHVLVELRQEENYAQAETLWGLTVKVYLSAPEFERLDGDRRKTYVAGLAVEACDHLQTLRRVAGVVAEEKPSFITALGEYLASISQGQQGPQGQQGKKRRRENTDSSSLQTSEGASSLPTPWSGDLESLPGMPMSFEDIDWLFDTEYQFFADLEQPKSIDAGEFQFGNL